MGRGRPSHIQHKTLNSWSSGRSKSCACPQCKITGFSSDREHPDDWISGGTRSAPVCSMDLNFCHSTAPRRLYSSRANRRGFDGVPGACCGQWPATTRNPARSPDHSPPPSGGRGRGSSLFQPLKNPRTGHQGCTALYEWSPPRDMEYLQGFERPLEIMFGLKVLQVPQF